jgi:hypothetical protein
LACSADAREHRHDVGHEHGERDPDEAALVQLASQDRVAVVDADEHGAHDDRELEAADHHGPAAGQPAPLPDRIHDPSRSLVNGGDLADGSAP